MVNNRTDNKLEYINIMEKYIDVKTFIYNYLLANYQLSKYSWYNIEWIKQVIYCIISKNIFWSYVNYTCVYIKIDMLTVTIFPNAIKLISIFSFIKILIILEKLENI